MQGTPCHIPLKAIAIFYQGRKQGTSEDAARLVSMLRQRGYEVLSIDIRNEGEEPEAVSSQGELTTSLKGYDLVMGLGGDGTIVHASRICAAADVAILRVKSGPLGFLKE